jgi:general secretion pathway protein D
MTMRIAQLPRRGSGALAGDNPPSQSQNETGSHNPLRRIRFDFRDVDIDTVLKVFSMAAGETLIKDSGLSGKVTILIPQPVSLDQGFHVLEAVLNSRGYTLQQDSLLLRVVPNRGLSGFGGDQASRARRGEGGMGSFGGGIGPGGFTDGGLGGGSAPGDGGFGGRGRGPQVSVFKLSSASAQQVARIINELFRSGSSATDGGRGGPGGLGGFGGRFGGPGAGFGGPDGGGLVGPDGGGFGGPGGGFPFLPPGLMNVQADADPQDPSLASVVGTAVRASADDYTNSVVVVAPLSLTEQIRTLVGQLDQQVSPTILTRVFHLEHGNAQDLAPIVSNVLLGAASTGASGGALQSVPWEQRVQLSAQAGSANAASGQVVADSRTNSLVVSTTAENMATVESLVRELDTTVHPKPTTLVIRLENARATDLATLLNQAFSSTPNRGAGSSGFRGNTSQGNTNPFFNTGNGGFMGGGFGGGSAGPGGFNR